MHHSIVDSSTVVRPATAKSPITGKIVVVLERCLLGQQRPRPRPRARKAREDTKREDTRQGNKYKTIDIDKARQTMSLSTSGKMGVSKFIAKTGLCSHTVAKRLLQFGMVTIDGRKAGPLDSVSIVEGSETTGMVCHEPVFVFDNKVIKDPKGRVIGYEAVCKNGAPPGGTLLGGVEPREYWMFHKPVGVDCRVLPDQPDSIVHYLPSRPRLFPVGRLDKDSRGQIILTNDGKLTERMMHPEFKKRKTYHVKVHRAFDDCFLQNMAEGVTYGRYVDVKTKPCETKRISQDTFEIVLTQGLNRQIRKMSASLGYAVVDLIRIQMQSLQLGSLSEGEMRRLTSSELCTLRRELELVPAEDEGVFARSAAESVPEDLSRSSYIVL